MSRAPMLSLALVVVGCSGGADLPELPGPTAGAAGVVEVPVATVTSERITVPILASGATEPLRAADLGPQLTARVVEVYVDEGDHVTVGQPLVRLDVRDASLRAAQAAAGAASADVQARQAASEYQRLAPLAERGTIPAQQVDQLEAQRDALAGAARAAQAMAAQARRGVSQSVVTAPFAGTVSMVLAEVGEVATMMPPTVLVRLVDLSEVEVSVRVNERDLVSVSVGDPAEVHFPSLRQTASGRVTFISPELDPRSRTATVTTRIPNPEGAIRAGLFAELTIRPSASREGLVVPRTAVLGSGEQAAAYLISDGHAERRTLTMAPIDDDRVEVVEGLSAGDIVASGGLDRLADGVAARARSPEPAAEAAPPPEATP